MPQAALSPDEKQKALSVIRDAILPLVQLKALFNKPIRVADDPLLREDMDKYHAHEDKITREWREKGYTGERWDKFTFIKRIIDTCGKVEELNFHTASLLHQWVRSGSKDAIVYQTSGQSITALLLEKLVDMRTYLSDDTAASPTRGFQDGKPLDTTTLRAILTLMSGDFNVDGFVLKMAPDKWISPDEQQEYDYKLRSVVALINNHETLLQRVVDARLSSMRQQTSEKSGSLTK